MAAQLSARISAPVWRQPASDHYNWRLIPGVSRGMCGLSFFHAGTTIGRGLAVSPAAAFGRGMGGNVYGSGTRRRAARRRRVEIGLQPGLCEDLQRLPAERQADAVRFCLGEEQDGVLHVLFVCERAYLPAGHGELLYEKGSGAWLLKHEDACVQRMAECYVQAQMARRAHFGANEHRDESPVE